MSENTISKIKIKDIEYELGTTIDNVSGLQDILNSKSDADHVHGVATTTTAGFMSAADKVKLDALNGSGGGEGGSVNIDTTLSVTGFAADAKAVGDALANKQDKLTFDTTPTSGSTNPVTSGGLFSEFATQGEKIEMTNMIANMAMPGSLKWDGYVGDRECVIFSEEIDEFVTVRTQLVHVSDYIPKSLLLIMGETPAEERICTVLCSVSGLDLGGVHETFPMQVQVADDMSIISEYFGYIPTDGYSVEGFTFPKKGWYFMSHTYCVGDIELSLSHVSGLKLDVITFPDRDADKYFESVNGTTYCGDTITWDGNVDGRAYVEEKAGNSWVIRRVKISDSVLTMGHFLNGVSCTTSQGDNMEISYEDLFNRAAFHADGFIADATMGVSVIPYDDYTYTNGNKSLVFPEAGTYLTHTTNTSTQVQLYITSFTVPNYDFIITAPQKVIKTEHLPKALQFGEITKTVGGDTLTWDGNIEGLVDVEGLLYKVSDAVPTANDMSAGIVLDASIPEGCTIMSRSESVELSEGVYRAYVHVNFPDGAGPSSVVYIIPQNMAGVDCDGTVFPESGVYFSNHQDCFIKSFTINGYTGFENTTTETVKIDQKYLPEALQFGEIGSDTLTLDGNMEGLEAVDFNGLDLYKVCNNVITMDLLSQGCFIGLDGMNIDVTECLVDTGQAISGEICAFIYNDFIYNDSEIPVGVYLPLGTTSLTIPGYTGFPGVKKIDHKYLPDDIGGGTSVQPDWNQTDETAADFIKNKPFGVEVPIISTETIMRETTFEGFSEGYLEVNDCYIDVIADTDYVVTWDGTEYDVTTREIDFNGLQIIVFGNPVIIGFDENPEDNGQPFAFLFTSVQMTMMLLSDDLEATKHTISIVKKTLVKEVHKIDDKYIDAAWMAQKVVNATTVLPETTAVITADGVNDPNWGYDIEALLAAEYVDVLWNGATYRCTVKYIEGAGMYVFGNLSMMGLETYNDRNEPFMFIIEGSMLVVSAQEETQATFSIIGYKSDIVSTIPDEYLPECLQGLGEEYIGEIYKDVITWDGDTTGRAMFENQFWHVSNAVPRIQDLMNGGVITLANNDDLLTVNFDASHVIDRNPGVFYLIHQYILVLSTSVPANNIEAGIYFVGGNNLYVQSLEVNNYTFVETAPKIKIIDKKLLPEECFGSGLPEVSSDDDGAFLRVVNGSWAVTTLPSVEDGEF